MRKLAQFLLIGCFLALPAVAQRGGGGHGGGGGVMAAVSTVAVVVSMAEWAVSTGVALAAQDSVVGSVGSTVDFMDSTAAFAAASFLGTALSSASDLIPRVTGLTTAQDGVILIPAIRITITLTLTIRIRPGTPITALRPRLRL
jgi:hypothetical protein